MASIPDLNGRQILIVDDSPQFANILSRILSASMGATAIDHVDNTEAGLVKLSDPSHEYTLVFLDFHFPQGMNGAELLLKIKEGGFLRPQMIVFIMSSDPTAQTLQTVVKTGASGVIAKPFERELLTEQISRALREKGGGGDLSF